MQVIQLGPTKPTNCSTQCNSADSPQNITQPSLTDHSINSILNKANVGAKHRADKGQQDRRLALILVLIQSALIAAAVTCLLHDQQLGQTSIARSKPLLPAPSLHPRLQSSITRSKRSKRSKHPPPALTPPGKSKSKKGADPSSIQVYNKQLKTKLLKL